MPTRVVIKESGLRHLLHSETSSVNRHVAAKAAEVTTYAHNNVLPHYRSGDLLGRLRFAGMFDGPVSLYAVVGTDPEHGGFNYARALEEGGVTPQGKSYQYPFLVPALEQAGFRRRS